MVKQVLGLSLSAFKITLAVDKMDRYGLSNTVCCESLTTKTYIVDTVLTLEGDAYQQ